MFDTRKVGDNDGWSPGRSILNGAGSHRPEHSLWPHVPVLARVVWADTGEEEWLESEAMGWTGDLVYVNMWHTKYSANACWLRAADVRRR
jgi:hypothetical protein